MINRISEQLETLPQVKTKKVLNEAAMNDEINCKKLINIIQKETGIGFTFLPKVLGFTDKKISTLLVMYLTDKKTPRYLRATKKRKIKEYIDNNLELKSKLEIDYKDVLDLFLQNVELDLWKKNPANS